MKSAKKILSVFLAVLMLFSVMSVGIAALNVTIDGSYDDVYVSTDDVIIAVPETIYMTPGDGESVKGQYYVNNTVDASGKITLAAESANGWGSISVYAPGSTAFSFTANAVAGGIGDPIIGSANTSATATFEDQRWENTALGGTTGYASYASCALYINGKGLTLGQTALIEWEVTVYFGDDDTTGKTYYAYTTLYMPGRSVGAVAEARRSSTYNNEISSWITGVTGVSGDLSFLGSDRIGSDGRITKGYFRYDPLWTSIVINNTDSGCDTTEDYTITSSTERYVSATTVADAEWSRAVGYIGYVHIDASRYTNTNQIPNFKIGSDALRVCDEKKDSLERYYAWYYLGDGSESIGSDEDSTPSGWTQFVSQSEPQDGSRTPKVPEFSVDGINGKYLHVASQAYCTYLSDKNYSNAYVSAMFVVTDKSDLRAAVIQATSLDETKYTTDSWRGASPSVVEGFLEALREAAEVLGNPAASQEQIDSALENLTAKKNSLRVAIKFDAVTNGGVFTDNEEVKEYDVQFGANNEVELKAAILNYFSVARYGYELAGWSLDPNDPASASLESVKGVTFGDTLYAHYKKTIAVDFNYLADKKGNTDVRTESIVIYNDEKNALDVNVSDADDVDVYTFAGWTQDPESTEGADIGDTLEDVTESKAYYATYVKELTLTLDANGGTPALDTVTGGVYYNYNLTQSTGDAIVTLPETEPTKTGYGFKGWDIGGTVYQPGDEVAFSGNTTEATATAVWGVETYDVTFNYKNANGSDLSVTVEVEYGQPATAPEIPEYYANQTMHYKFLNWSDSFDVITGDTVINAMYANGAMHNFTTEGTPNCEETVDVTYTCETCKYSYTITFEKGHNYVVTDSKDATCEEDGYITYTCQRDASHTYTETVKATGHSFENTEYVAPTCTENGYYISGTCGTCGEDLAGKTIPALGHNFVVETEATCDKDGKKVCTGYTDASGVHHDCDATETIPAFGHSYTSTTVPAACGKEGSVTYTCSICDHSYSVTIPALEHHYSKMVIAPTCTSQGYTATTCTLCGISTRENYVPALGHTLKSVVVAPTCTEQGYTKHTCTVCNYSYKTDYVDAIGHNYSTETVVAPTCTERGYTLHTCANCGDTYKSDFVDATGHDYKHTNTVNATATMAGYYLYECTKCDSFYKDMQYTGGKALLCVTLSDTSGEAVTNATITLTNNATFKEIVITTDANGYFTHVVPEGEYTVSIVRNGYFCESEGSLAVELGTADLKLPAVAKNPCDCLCHQNTFWAKIYRVLIKMFSIFGKIYCCDCSEIWG
ncbi:MAG: carboxypeptidase regulatory-like domain-containing protein [Clostridia bacterium]|nr:carboxypeptidase regulatory-like domain-containing protein [Clostridia bacterium]